MKNSLAIAYAAKKKFARKKMGGMHEAKMPEEEFQEHGTEHMAHGGKMPKLGSGKRFSNLEHELAHKPGIHDPKALAAAIGRKKFGAHKMGELAAHGRKHMAEGGMVNEDLDPMSEPSGLTETHSIADERLDGKAFNHEDLPEPVEPMEHVEPEAEDMGRNMADGGMVEDERDEMDRASHVTGLMQPKGIAEAVFKRMRGGKEMQDQSSAHFADGGEVDNEDTWTDRPGDGDSIDNFHAETHPDNDFLSGEEQTEYHHLTDADYNEPDQKMRRKGMLDKIMRGLHARHMGK